MSTEPRGDSISQSPQKSKGPEVRSSEADIGMSGQLGFLFCQLKGATRSLSSSLDVALEVGSPCQGHIPAEDLRVESKTGDGLFEQLQSVGHLTFLS